jgi:ABC-type multidrug transport system ATPase subunit
MQSSDVLFQAWHLYIFVIRTGTLSGGQRKRAEVGLELLTEPKLLFLDEPTSALDAYTALNFIQWMKKVATSRNSTIVMSIHQPREEARSFYSRLVARRNIYNLFISLCDDKIAHLSIM